MDKACYDGDVLNMGMEIYFLLHGEGKTLVVQQGQLNDEAKGHRPILDNLMESLFIQLTSSHANSLSASHSPSNYRSNCPMRVSVQVGAVTSRLSSKSRTLL
jgi:hypothetical protein